MGLDQLVLDVGRTALMFMISMTPGTKDQPYHDPGFEPPSQLGTKSYAVSMNNLDPKRLPVEVMIDEDRKDFAVKGNRRYKPAKKDETAGPLKQLQMRAKRDDAEVCVEGEMSYDGDFDQSVRASIDTPKGLVDGKSLAFLEIRSKGENTVLYRVEAVWNAAIDGFSVRVTVDGTPTGATQDYPGVYRVQMFAGQLEGEITLSVAAAGAQLFDYTDYVDLHTAMQEVGDIESCLAFGAEGLDKGGAMYFADMALTGSPDDLELTEAEMIISSATRQAAFFGGTAEIFSDPKGFLGDMVSARNAAIASAIAYGFAESTLNDSAGTGNLTGKRLKLLKASIKKGKKAAEKAADRAQKVIDKGAVFGDTDAQTEKQSQKARNFGDLATAQMFGLDSRSVDHVYDWFDW